MLLGGNPNGYEVAEHIAKTVEVNPRMISTLKTHKIHLNHKPREGGVETSVVGPLGILVALVKIQIGNDYSDSRRFSGRPSQSPFLSIHFSLMIEKLPKC